MISVDIPGFGAVKIKHLVCDYSGTLSVDGELISGVKETLGMLSEKVDIHIITADTHGKAGSQLMDIECTFKVIEGDNQHFQKEAFVRELGADNVFAIGNGNNDTMMLSAARVGVAVCLNEGVSAMAVNHADIAVNSIEDAFGLLLHPNRLKATLRF
jgi:soluble P-type ATPase